MADWNWWLPWYVDAGIGIAFIPGIILLAHYVLGPWFAGEDVKDYVQHDYSYIRETRGTTVIVGTILALIWWPMVLGAGLMLAGIWGTFKTFDALESADERRLNKVKEKAAAEKRERELRDQIRSEIEAEYQDPLSEINKALKEKTRR